jgi:hypothetical protein
MGGGGVGSEMGVLAEVPWGGTGPMRCCPLVVDHGFMDSWMTLDDIGYGPHSGPDPTGSGLVLLTS